MTADRIVLCQLLMQKIEEQLNGLENVLVAKYVLTKFLMLFTVRKVFETDEFGRSVLLNPEIFVRDINARTKFLAVVDELLDGLIVDLNVETIDLGDDFDYRGKLRDKEYVSGLASELIASYQKDLKRKKARPMLDCWKLANGGS